MSFILIVCDKVIWQLQRYLRKLNSLNLCMLYLLSYFPVYKNNKQKGLFQKAQTSLRTCAVWSEHLLVAWIFHDSEATVRTLCEVSKHNRRLRKLVWVFTFQNVTLMEISCRSLINILLLFEYIWYKIETESSFW